MISRRRALGALGAGLGIAAIAGTRLWRKRPAAGGPCAAVAGRTIRWIVPYASGGGYDAESRLLEPFLEHRLRAAIVIENVPGAGGILGARTIAAATPDGLTLGIVGVPGLLLAAMTGRTEAPDPAEILTILGRTGRERHVWVAGNASPLKTIDDVLAAGRTRSLVFAINEVGSANVPAITVTAALLGVTVELVAGFAGTRSASMAALRGDVDMVCFDFDTFRDLNEAGELRPLLQVSPAPIAPHPTLAGVPTLGGPDGWAMRRARSEKRDQKGADALEAALFAVMGSGRVVVAPPGLDSRLSECLSSALYETLSSPEVRAASTRQLDVASSAAALADVRASKAAAPLLLPMVLDAMRRMRQ